MISCHWHHSHNQIISTNFINYHQLTTFITNFTSKFFLRKKHLFHTVFFCHPNKGCDFVQFRAGRLCQSHLLEASSGETWQQNEKKIEVQKLGGGFFCFGKGWLFSFRFYRLCMDIWFVYTYIYMNIYHIDIAIHIYGTPPKDLPVFVFYWYLRGFTASSRIPPKFDFWRRGYIYIASPPKPTFCLEPSPSLPKKRFPYMYHCFLFSLWKSQYSS